MANVETMGLGPQKSMFVLVIIVGCFAVLWPRILSPMFVGQKDTISPNNYDKAAGCCDVVFETDVDAIKIMTELCGNILRSHKDGIDSKTEQAFQTGKLTKAIINMCRQEVNRTCGVDIELFLNHNIGLGRTYKQILDDIRSYNSSNCLKMNYGVAPWTLGIPHLVGKFWIQGLDSKSVRQERPAHLRHPPLHPAMRERGRAIPPPPPVAAHHPSAPLQTGGPMQGRVWPSQLHVYLSNYTIEPIPMRPPMGGAGRVVSPPKSSVGFLMPLYTLCIVVFFFYTIFKMVFRKSNTLPAGEPMKYVPERPESEFRQTVFKRTSRSNRATPETKLVVNAISGLVAEVRQQLEEEPLKHDSAVLLQDTPTHPYTNGSVPHSQREESPILSKVKDFSRFKETTPPSWEASTPVHREETVLAEEFSPPPKDVSQLGREPTPVKTFKESTPPPKEDIEVLPVKERSKTDDESLPPKEEIVVVEPEDKEIEEKRVVEKIGVQHEEDIQEKPAVDEEAIRQLRSSVEKENATVKVLGMEMRAHCEGGRKWSQRPPTPPAAIVRSPTPPVRHPTPPVEVSSIYLEGALPHQSRLLVADSETHTEKLTNGDDKDPPIVLSGKMTLSLINDTSTKTTPERDYAIRDDSILDDDDEFLTASAATAPKQEIEDDYEDGSEEEDEEIEEDEIVEPKDNEIKVAADNTTKNIEPEAVETQAVLQEHKIEEAVKADQDEKKVVENGIKKVENIVAKNTVSQDATKQNEQEEEEEEEYEEEEVEDEVEDEDEKEIEEPKVDNKAVIEIENKIQNDNVNKTKVVEVEDEIEVEEDEIEVEDDEIEVDEIEIDEIEIDEIEVDEIEVEEDKVEENKMQNNESSEQDEKEEIVVEEAKTDVKKNEAEMEKKTESSNLNQKQAEEEEEEEEEIEVEEDEEEEVEIEEVEDEEEVEEEGEEDLTKKKHTKDT